MKDSSIQSQIKNCIQNEKQYKDSIKAIILKVKENLNSKDQELQKTIVDSVKKILNNEGDFKTCTTNIEKFQSLLLLKECLDQKDGQMALYVTKKILKRLLEFVKKSPNYGPQFDQLLIECLFMWPKQYKSTIEFAQCRDELFQLGIKQPITFKYFEVQSEKPPQQKLNNSQKQQQQQISQKSTQQEKTKPQQAIKLPKLENNQIVQLLSETLSSIDENFRTLQEWFKSMDFETIMPVIPQLMEVGKKLNETYIAQLMETGQYERIVDKSIKAQAFICEIEQDFKRISDSNIYETFKDTYYNKINEYLNETNKQDVQQKVLKKAQSKIAEVKKFESIEEEKEINRQSDAKQLKKSKINQKKEIINEFDQFPRNQTTSNNQNWNFDVTDWTNNNPQTTFNTFEFDSKPQQNYEDPFKIFEQIQKQSSQFDQDVNQNSNYQQNKSSMQEQQNQWQNRQINPLNENNQDQQTIIQKKEKKQQKNEANEIFQEQQTVTQKKIQKTQQIEENQNFQEQQNIIHRIPIDQQNNNLQQLNQDDPFENYNQIQYQQQQEFNQNLNKNINQSQNQIKKQEQQNQIQNNQQNNEDEDEDFQEQMRIIIQQKKQKQIQDQDLQKQQQFNEEQRQQQLPEQQQIQYQKQQQQLLDQQKFEQQQIELQRQQFQYEQQKLEQQKLELQRQQQMFLEQQKLQQLNEQQYTKKVSQGIQQEFQEDSLKDHTKNYIKQQIQQQEIVYKQKRKDSLFSNSSKPSQQQDNPIQQDQFQSYQIPNQFNNDQQQIQSKIVKKVNPFDYDDDSINENIREKQHSNIQVPDQNDTYTIDFMKDNTQSLYGSRRDFNFDQASVSQTGNVRGSFRQNSEIDVTEAKAFNLEDFQEFNLQDLDEKANSEKNISDNNFGFNNNIDPFNVNQIENFDKLDNKPQNFDIQAGQNNAFQDMFKELDIDNNAQKKEYFAEFNFDQYADQQPPSNDLKQQQQQLDFQSAQSLNFDMSNWKLATNDKEQFGFSNQENNKQVKNQEQEVIPNAPDTKKDEAQTKKAKKQTVKLRNLEQLDILNPQKVSVIKQNQDPKLQQIDLLSLASQNEQENKKNQQEISSKMNSSQDQNVDLLSFSNIQQNTNPLEKKQNFEEVDFSKFSKEQKPNSNQASDFPQFDFSNYNQITGKNETKFDILDILDYSQPIFYIHLQSCIFLSDKIKPEQQIELIQQSIKKIISQQQVFIQDINDIMGLYIKNQQDILNDISKNNESKLKSLKNLFTIFEATYNDMQNIPNKTKQNQSQQNPNNIDGNQQDLIVQDLKKKNQDLLLVCQELEKTIKQNEEKIFYLQKTIEEFLQSSQNLKSENKKIIQELENYKISNQNLINQKDLISQESEKLKTDIQNIVITNHETQLKYQSLKDMLQQQQMSLSNNQFSNTQFLKQYNSEQQLINDQIDKLKIQFKTNDLINMDEQVDLPILYSDLAQNLSKIIKLSETQSQFQKDPIKLYFSNKKQNQQKKNLNRIFYNQSIFDDIINLPIYQLNNNELDNYRYSCLMERAILFENEIMQVGIINKYISQGDALKEQFNIQFHFINKSHDSIELTMQIKNYSDNIQSNKELKQPIQIRKQIPFKHDICVYYFDIILNQPILSFQYKCLNQTKFAQIPLPVSINKFFQFEFIDQLQFKNKWSLLKQNVIKNEPRQLNRKFVRTLNDFKRYFEHLTEMRKGNKVYLIGMFNYKSNQYLVKIRTMQEQNEADINLSTFALACHETLHQTAQYIINNFCFLFTL